MKSDHTEIAFVLDSSGSMMSIKPQTILGYNSFVEAQTAEPGTAAISLTTFSDKLNTHCESVPLAEAPKLTEFSYRPNGSTALYDAIGVTIIQLGNRLAALPEAERPGKVIFAVLTDGEENASVEYSLDTVAQIIKHQTEVYNWQFLFLGANIDVVAVSKSLNIPAVNAIAFAATDQGTQEVYRSVTNTVSTMRAGN